jgi:hypothetical protein
MRAIRRRGVKVFKQGDNTPRESLYKSCPGYLTRIRVELLGIKNFAGARGESESIRRMSIVNARGGMSTNDGIKHSYSRVVVW